MTIQTSLRPSMPQRDRAGAPILGRGMRDYALLAGVRLCDPGKPLLVGLAIEALIASSALASWARAVARAPGTRRRSERRRDRSRTQAPYDRRKGIFAHDARQRSRAVHPARP